MDASYVDLADARHLEFDYLRRMRDVVLAAGARRVVHVGGAGCALARALASADPGHRQEVIELDRDVVELARRHLGLRRAPGLRVRVGDGRAVLARRPDGSADAVLVDAFVGARVPRHLVTRGGAGRPGARVGAGRGQRGRRAGRWATPPRSRPGCAAAFPHVLALGAAGVLGKRRSGNVVSSGRTRCRRWSACARARRPTARRARCWGPGRSTRSSAARRRGRTRISSVYARKRSLCTFDVENAPPAPTHLRHAPRQGATT